MSFRPRVRPRRSTLLRTSAGLAAGQTDTYLQQVVKLIPTEVVGAWVTISGILANSTMTSEGAIEKLDATTASWMRAAFAILVVVAVVYTHRATREPGRRPAWGQIVVAPIAFALWVYALGGQFPRTVQPKYQERFAAVALVLGTLLFPMLHDLVEWLATRLAGERAKGGATATAAATTEGLGSVHTGDDFWGEDPALLLARCLFGEARSEGDEGQRAVAYVVKNRMAEKGRSVHEVVLQPNQFSCFNPQDPNYAKLKDPERYDAAAWRACTEVARRCLADAAGTLNPVDGATHYHATSVPAPPWANGATTVKTIGRHVFLKGIAYSVPPHAQAVV